MVTLPQGKIVLSHIRDISNIEKLAEESRSAKEFSENLVDTANAMVVKLDLEGNILVFNEAAEQITGYTREEVTGKNWFAFMLPEAQRPHVWNYFKKLSDPDFYKNYENLILTKSGEERYVVWQNSVDREQGQPKGLVCFGIDVTEQRKAEEILRKEGEYIKGVIEGLAFPFFVVNREYQYILFNQAHVQSMKNVYGVNIELGKSILDFHDSLTDREKVRQNIDKALGGSACIVEGYVGDERFSKEYVLIEHNPVRDNQGEVLGAVVVVHDISKRKKAMEEARASDLRYRQLVEDTHVIIMSLGPEGKIGFINSYGLNLFGYSESDILGHSLEETVLPKMETTGRNLWKLYQNLLASGNIELRETHENLLLSGRRVWIDWTVRRGVNPLNGEQGWLCVGVDVTFTRRAQEEEVKGYERRRYNKLMNNILEGRISGEDIQKFSKQQGINLAGPFICIVMSKPVTGAAKEDEAQRQREIDAMVDNFKERSRGVVWQTMEGIAILLPCDGTNNIVAIKEVRQKVKIFAALLERSGYGKKIPLGVSHQTSTVVSIPELYGQALAALELGLLNKPALQIHYWHELGWLRLLTKNIRSPETQQFVIDHLGPLISFPHQEKRELLMRTLRDLLSGEAVDSIARRLNVHPQTIRYRKRLLEELLGEFLSDGETKTNMSIAIKIFSMQQAIASNQ
jgi:PAS domain S-box-containing protein